MKWSVIFFSLLFFADANAQGILGGLGRRLGIGDFTTPLDALGIFRTGTCEAQLDTFRNTPRRTYRWLTSGDQEASDYLDSVSSVATPECAQRLAYHMAYLITKHGKTDQRRNNRRAQAANRSLQRFLGMSGNDATADSYLTEIRSCFEPAERRANPIQTIINDIAPIARRSDNCSPVTADRVKVVSGIQGDISNAYGLRRNENGGYEVLLNYEFLPMSVTNKSFAMSANEHIPTPQEMMERTRACFAEASPFLRGPGGETLTFQALTPTEVTALPRDQRPPLWSINLVNNAQRGHSAAFNDSFDCATIIHETLHVLGLCDEYEERDLSLLGRCRVTTLPNTIMNLNIPAYRAGTNQMLQCTCDSSCQEAQTNPELWRIYSGNSFLTSFPPDLSQYCRANSNYRFLQPNELTAAQPLKVLSTTSNQITFEEVYVHPQRGLGAFTREWDCTCEGSNEVSCPNSLRTIIEQSRNLSALPILTCPGGHAPISREVVAQIPAGPNNQVRDGVLTRFLPATQPSLLAPAHFNRIINGLCENPSTSNYVRCADWAYRDSSCSSRPASCENPQYFLGL